MAFELKYDTLDEQRKKILPQLKFLKKDFYLAGGTALALQIGHRRSIDFDFFTQNPFDNFRLFIRYEQIFDKNVIEKTQDSKDTLSILIDKKIKISMFHIPYPVVSPLIVEKNLALLHVLEIGVMKLIALTRAALRDYVDLYYILQNYSLDDIFILARKKFKNFDEGIYLKCLLSYDDVEIAPIDYMKGFKKSESEIFSVIEKTTLDYIKNN
ncbi:nucleotidyl transferase AbiEii/AbiGii toxin family protein [candidate division KSB1 bacterium]|nr:nucleotidyl transferase AbiEii/AbiGii toxin family protein [candidate division KSB1 bacterium]